MGTRGFLGFVVDGQEKLAYNHFDSYPEGLGTQVLGFLRDVAENNAARNLRDEASWPLADLPDEETFLATFRSDGDE